MVSAQENATDIIQDELIPSQEFEDEITVFDDDFENSTQAVTQLKINCSDSYYKENNNIISYLKDINGTPIKNKQLNVFLDGKQFNKTTDNSGKISISCNLKPNTYKLSVKFNGDENFTASEASSTIKIKKTPLAIKMSNYNTYVDSDLFFKVKVYNKITGKAVSEIKVKFKVYSTKTKKYYYYYATTNEKGIASLNKNFRVGTYKISANVHDSKNKKYISYKVSKNKVTMKVKPTGETGCCSFYLQISSDESVAGFRRDATNALNIYIKHVKWHGRTAIKQYKLGYSYFFHSITTSDGWMVGTGGIDNPGINRAIEKLAGSMVKENKIKKSTLKKIQNYERRLGLGHF
jgi:predicted transport protein